MVVAHFIHSFLLESCGYLQSYLPVLFRMNPFNAASVSQSASKSQLVFELGPAQPQLFLYAFTIFCVFWFLCFLDFMYFAFFSFLYFFASFVSFFVLFFVPFLQYSMPNISIFNSFSILKIFFLVQSLFTKT